MRWEWVPGRSIGPLRFGEALEAASLPFAVRLVDREDEMTTFEVLEDGSRIATEDGIVVFVECVTSCVLRERNLVGMPPSEAQRWIGGSWTVADENPLGRQLDCEELGITLWEEEGRVESVTMWGEETTPEPGS